MNAAGGLTRSALTGFRELLHLVASNEAGVNVLDLSELTEFDPSADEVIREFSDLCPNVRVVQGSRGGPTRSPAEEALVTSSARCRPSSIAPISSTPPA